MTYTFNKKKVIKLLKEQNIEYDQIDFNSYSGDISLEEWLSNEYNIVLKGLKDKYDDVKAAELMVKDNERKQLEQEEKRLIEEIKNIPAMPIAQFPTFLNYSALLNALIQSPDIHFMVAEGEGGTGKSYCTINGLKNYKADYVYLNSKITPLQLYAFLHKHKDNKVIVLDDIITLLKSDISISLLLGAMWANDGKRTIHYHSTSKLFEDLGLPNFFDFNSKVIILTNTFNLNNEVLAALRDRGFFFNFDFTYKEKIAIMKELIKIPNFLDYEKKKTILDYIEQKSNPSSNSISFRLLLKAYSIYAYCSDKWEILLDVLIKPDDSYSFVYKTFGNTEKTLKEWINEFVSLGLGSRARFFRIKKQLVSKSH